MPPHDVQRMGQLGLIVTAACAIPARSALTGWRLASPPLAVLVALLTGTIANGRWGLIETAHLASLLLLGTLFATRLRQAPEAQILGVMLLLPGLYVLLLLPRWAAMLFENLTFHPHEFFTGFSNQRFFGHWVTITLPLMALARLRAPPATQRVGYLLDLLAALWVCFALASGSRGTWAAVIIVMAVLTISGGTARRLSGSIARSVLIGVALYCVMFVLLPWLYMDAAPPAGVSRLAEGATLSGREVLWSLAWSGIFAHPFLGAGPMSFAATSNHVAAHPHNLFLQLAYEWGLPVALACAVLIVRWLGSLWLSASRDEDPVRLALCAGVLGALLQSQVDGLLVMPFGQCLLAVICGWLASLDRGARVFASRTKHAEENVSVTRVLVLTLGLLQILFTIPESSRLENWEKEGLAKTGLEIYQPRFWFQGVIPSIEPVFSNQLIRQLCNTATPSASPHPAPGC